MRSWGGGGEGHPTWLRWGKRNVIAGPDRAQFLLTAILHELDRVHAESDSVHHHVLQVEKEMGAVNIIDIRDT